MDQTYWDKLYDTKLASYYFQFYAQMAKRKKTCISAMAVLLKNVTTYQKTKSVYDAYRQAQNKDSYRAEHEHRIILHEAAAKALRVAGVYGKYPNVAALQAEYEKLQQQKEALYAVYGKIKEQVRNTTLLSET